MRFYCQVLVLSMAAGLGSGGRILVVPAHSGNAFHIRPFAELAEELAQRDHEVLLWGPVEMDPSTLPELKHAKAALFQTKTRKPTEAKAWQQSSHVAAVWDEIKAENERAERQLEVVLKGHRPAIDKVFGQKWDAVVADDESGTVGCLLAQLVSAPLVRYRRGALSEGSAYSMALPYPPAAVPSVVSDATLPMGIAARAYVSCINKVLGRYGSSGCQQCLGNLLLVAMNAYGNELDRYRLLDEVVSRAWAVEGRLPLSEIRRNTDFLLVQQPIGLSWPRPTQPNVVSLPGLSCPADLQSQPLPQDVVKKMDTVKGGVIVVSFSETSWEEAPKEVAENLVATFGRMKEHLFLWRYDGPPLGNRSKNVVFLPASADTAALLQQGRVKALVSDGGWESCMAALCGGVPLLGLPLKPSQAGNVARLARRRAALALPKAALYDGDKLREGLMELLSRPSFRHAVGALKQGLDDEIQDSVDAAVFWTEFAVRHRGAGALKHDAQMNISLVSYLCLDVWYVALALCLLALSIAARLPGIFFGLLCPAEKAKLKTQ